MSGGSLPPPLVSVYVEINPHLNRDLPGEGFVVKLSPCVHVKREYCTHGFRADSPIMARITE